MVLLAYTSNFYSIMADKNRVTLIAAFCLAFAGFVLNLIAYCPGFMSPDSLEVYLQSIDHHYLDSHPPVMAALWSVFNKFYQSPVTMLLLQLALFWASFYLLATTWLSSRRNQVFLFVGVLLAPFIQNFLGYLIGDSQMALSWLFSFCLIARAEYKKRRMTVPEAVFSFLFLLYGSLVRINALPGALPLFYFYFANCLRWTQRRSLIVGATLISAAVVIGCQVLSKHIFQPEKKYPEYKLYLQDISGIYVKTGKNYFPSFITQYKGFDTNYLKSNFTTATIDNLYYGDRAPFPRLTDSNSNTIHRAWITSILDNPGIYLQNRWEGFLYFLHIKKRSWLVVLHAEVSPNNLGITFRRNFISNLFLAPISFQSWMIYMKPWFWLIVNIATLIAAFFIYDPVIKRSVLVLAASSFLYLAAEFFIVPVDTDFRYCYWNCLSLFISTAFLLTRRGFRPIK